MHLKHPETARPLLENALRIDAGQELAHLDLGILLADAGRRDDALRELSVAAKLAPRRRQCALAAGAALPRDGKDSRGEG